jgi:hypothetical protein
MQVIAQAFDQELRQAVAAGGTEPQIVRRFTQAAQNLNGAFGSQIAIDTAFVHQRPYALFRQPATICGHVRCELGDILLVIKHKVGKQTVDHRGTFLQAKKGAGSWPISPHQLEFLHNIGGLTFEFGKSVYKASGYQPITFQKMPWPPQWAHYLCLDVDTLVYASDRVYGQYPGQCASFTFRNALCTAQFPNCAGCDGFAKFIDDFTARYGPGLKVSGPAQQLFDIVYKRVGLVLDPPDEWSGYWYPIEPRREDPEGEGFSVIQVIVSGEAG